MTEYVFALVPVLRWLLRGQAKTSSVLQQASAFSAVRYVVAPKPGCRAADGRWPVGDGWWPADAAESAEA